MKFLGGAPASLCHFSIRPSVAHHIPETVHHLIIIFGTHVQNHDFSKCFFHFFEILFFWTVMEDGGVGGGWLKREKIAQNEKQLHVSCAISQGKYSI